MTEPSIDDQFYCPPPGHQVVQTWDRVNQRPMRVLECYMDAVLPPVLPARVEEIADELPPDYDGDTASEP